MNKAIICGNLGTDVDLRKTKAGDPVANFPVATSRSYTKDGEKVEQTEWHRVVVFGKRAEVCSQYLSKGRQVLVEGEMRTRDYEKEGQKHYTTEIVATAVKFLGGKSDNSSKDDAPF